MRALYALGRHVRALARYADYRRELGEELGLEPSAAMQRLETRILRQELPEPGGPGTSRTPAAPAQRLPEDVTGSSVALDRMQTRYVRDARGRRIAWATIGTGVPVVACPAWISSLNVISAGRDPRSSSCSGSPSSAGWSRTTAPAAACPRTRRATSASPPPPTSSRPSSGAWRNRGAVRDVAGRSGGGDARGSRAGPGHRAGPVRHLRRRSGPVHDEPLKQSVVSMVRAHWGLGSRLLADLYRPRISDEGARHLSAAMLGSASAEVAANYLEAAYDASVLELLPAVRTPALVLHYRGDRLVPYAGGRQLATGLPDARFLPLDGAYHLPDAADLPRIVGTVADFLASEVPAPA